jgi:chemotaxis protein methyltransferase WspC
LLCLIGDSLAVGGVLFVGHAEQFTRVESRLRPIAAPHSFALERIVPEEVAMKPAPAALPPAPSKRPQLAPRPTAASPRADAGEVVAPEATLAAARDLADAGRMAEGEAMARSIIARRGPTARALELLGMIRIAANDVAGARRLFEQAVYLEPERAASLLQLALLSERDGDSRRASMLWDRARRASGSAEKEAAR